MWHLLEVAPQSELLKGMNRVSSSRMQALLAAGAFESAAVELTGGAQYTTTLRRARHLASVRLPGDEQKGTCSADTFALSVVGALACALATRAEEPVVRLVSKVRAI
jgi:hypothetical protein